MIPVVWRTPNPDILNHIAAEANRTLAAYRIQPTLIEEHVGIEAEVLGGGYGHRQIHELVQNAADALTEAGIGGRVRVLLTEDALYCANEGAPIDLGGVTAILHSHISRKRGSQIGQFGLGFKSVLAVSDCPEFYSWSGSFAFNAEWARTEIRSAVPSVEATPVLRIAQAVDAGEAAEKDAVLASLMEWATTVIKLPRRGTPNSWLSEDLASFPAEFVIFAPQVSVLELEDRTTSVSRVIKATAVGKMTTITEGQASSVWWTFQSSVRVSELSPAAQADADRKTKVRDSLPLLWAVPLSGVRSRGRFWAFFPTETVTTVRGILNAPWKTNADRQNLLDGPFNQELLGRTAELVASSVTSLVRPDDPAWLLDVLPARVEDASNWADTLLARGIPTLLSPRRCVPDVSAELSVPATLKLRPEQLLDAAKSEGWALEENIEGPGWVHASVETRERRPRATRLGSGEATLTEWLEAVAAQDGAAGSRRALLAIHVLRETLPSWQVPALRGARVILTVNDELVSPNSPGLFMGGDLSSVRQVHPAIGEDAQLVPILRELGVAHGAHVAELEAQLKATHVDWHQVWQTARRLSSAEAVEVFKASAESVSILVRNGDGQFRPVSSSLLPGAIARLDEPGDGEVVIDTEYHAPDLEILRSIGATEAPVEGVRAWSEPWAEVYRDEQIAAFYSRLGEKKRPRRSRLGFKHTGTWVERAPLQPLLKLSLASRGRLTTALLPALQSEGRWSVGLIAPSLTYTDVNCEGPLAWLILRYGALLTSVGVRELSDCVGRSFDEWRPFFPVAPLDPELSALLRLPESMEGLTPDHWQTAFSLAANANDPRLCGRFYAAAARHAEVPDRLLVWQHGQPKAVGAQEAVVGIGAREDLQRSGLNVIEVQSVEEARVLADKWSLALAESGLTFRDTGPAVPILDFFPGLGRWLGPTDSPLSLQECSEILDHVGPRTHGRTGDVLLFESGTPLPKILKWVLVELGLTLSMDDRNAVLDQDAPGPRADLVEAVRRQESVGGKLAVLFSADELLGGLPPTIVETVRASTTDIGVRTVAEMAFAVHGVEILRIYSEALQRKGLAPPTKWAGTARALEFVDSLGFEPEFAGFERVVREPAVEVDGPLQLKPLHDYQQEIARRIREALSQVKPARGLVSLPTGSGKTRVAVEALVGAIVTGQFGRRCVVWIAQSDELCEQAVQSWTQVWRASGSSGRLRISRMWGSTNNRVAAAPEKFHVVVATFQTLKERIASPKYDWLRDAACVVIDEAHGAIAPSYTTILEQFGLTAHTTARPLLGLTATPFRGSWAEEETQRLVNRFGANRFDIAALPGDDPYPVLQERGVLAKIDHELLEGSTIDLTEAELESVDRFKVLPASAEARIGADPVRNKRIVDSIAGMPVTWPILVFAASVDHARLLAAMLSIAGISARSITGDMEVGARRHYIDEFKHARLRVLTNYGVLTTGFDAPAVRAIYLARPVFSPVLYQQMIGRGMRGPENGGKERCLLVNIADNVLQYGDRLAFRHFERLWLESGQ